MVDIKIIAQTDWEQWRVKTFAAKEPETLAWIDDFKDDAVFWDIGANIGVYSLYCAHKHPKSIVYAFEPLRNNYLRLWQNIWKNEFTNVEAHYVAVGNANDKRWFNAKTTDTGSSGGQIKEQAGTGMNYQVPVRSIDCMAEYLINPDYVKIDTDGNEYDVILGMWGTLHAVKSVLVEINDLSDEIHELMENAGLEPDEKYNSLKTRESDHNMIFTRF